MNIYKFFLKVLFFICFSTYACADNTYDYIAGNTGKIYVHGSLTESACRIEMDSTDQSINLGNIGTADLKNIGDRAPASTFFIKLEDCLLDNSRLVDDKTGLVTWSSSQPIFKIKFNSVQSDLNPNIIQVSGLKGLGLELQDINGDTIDIGSFARPQFLNKPKNTLTYKIVPIKTGALEPNEYSAIISFELVYE